MTIRIEDIEGAFQVSFGLPRPDWARIRASIEAHAAGSDPDGLWTEAARQWLAKLRGALGDEYVVHEYKSFLLLSTLGERRARNLLDLGERTIRSLGDIFTEPAVKLLGKYVCIALPSQDIYYDYISHFHPEGEWGASSGCFLDREGYGHLVLNKGDDSLDAVFVHELVHDFLSDGTLPLWVEEGITQVVERDVSPYPDSGLSRREARRHQRYWRRNGLESFWRGESFSWPESMGLSYALALVLILNMLGRGKEKYLAFLRSADERDCGDSASRAVYGFGIEEWARQFLGEGDWAPPPAAEAPD